MSNYVEEQYKSANISNAYELVQNIHLIQSLLKLLLFELQQNVQLALIAICIKL